MSRIHTRFSGLLASCRMMVLAAGLFFPAAAQADTLADLKVIPSKSFPEISYKDTKWKERTLRSDLGALTIVHLWATWCEPCIEELPQVDAIQEKFGPYGLKVIAISMDEANDPKTATKIITFLKRLKITHLFPYFEAGSGIAQKAGIQGMPMSFFIDSSGDEIAFAEGALDWKKKKVVDFIALHLPPAKQ